MPTTDKRDESLGLLTFHTNGERPDWVHDWETASRLLSEGLPFHTTQLGLIDSFEVRHWYDGFLFVDGPNEFSFRSDGDRWATDWTDRDLRKFHRILRMWEAGKLEGAGNASRIEAWERSVPQRQARDGALPPGEAPREATFMAGSGGKLAVHGWLSARVLIGMGMSFVTTQMELLNDPQVKGSYDRIVIIEDDGRKAVLERDGRGWVANVEGRPSERVLRASNNLFRLWRTGEFAS